MIIFPHTCAKFIQNCFHYKLHVSNSLFPCSFDLFFYRYPISLNYPNGRPAQEYKGMTIKEWKAFTKGKKFIYYDVSYVD